MQGTIRNEIEFVERAIEKHGPHFKHHLLSKGFTSDWFQHTWAAVTEIFNRQGLGPRVLDLGCGPGWTSIFLAGRGCRVTACDVAPDMLTLAKENATRLGLEIEFRELDMNRPLPLDPVFDTVLIFDALHHCPDERKVLQHCHDVLRPGGKILLVEPDWFHEYSPGSARARRDFGTTERGMGYRRMRKALLAAGFTRPRRYLQPHATCGGSFWERLKALGTVALTVSVGFPHRSAIALAARPATPAPQAALPLTASASEGHPNSRAEWRGHAGHANTA